MLSIRLGLAFSLAGFFGHALCQTPPVDVAPPRIVVPEDVPPQMPLVEHQIYENFFRQVIQLKTFDGQARVGEGIPNGGVVNVIVPKIQDVIGLTDADVELLNEMAADCLIKIANVQKRMSPLVFESRLQAVAGQVSNDSLLQAALAHLEDEHHQLVLDSVQRLKMDLGDAGFAKIDAYVHTPEAVRKALLPIVAHAPITVFSGEPPPARKQ